MISRPMNLRSTLPSLLLPGLVFVVLVVLVIAQRAGEEAGAPATGAPGAVVEADEGASTLRAAAGGESWDDIPSRRPGGERPGGGSVWLAGAAPAGRADSPTRGAGPSDIHFHAEVPRHVRAMSDEELLARLPEERRRALEAYRDGLAGMDPADRRYFCWQPGTDPVVIEAYHRAEVAGGLAPGDTRIQATQFLSSPRWSRTATNGSGNSAQGLPVTLTWSVVPDGTEVPGDDGSFDGPSNLRSRLAGLYGGSSTGAVALQPWFALFEEAFAHMGDECGITFVHEPADDGADFTSFGSGRGILGVRGDIRISGRNIDGNSGTLAFAYAPDYGDIVIDTGDSFFDSTFSNSVRLVNTLAHEIGHAVGLDHVCPVDQTKLMEPFISTFYRGAQFDEFQSLQRQYGDPIEAHSPLRNNDTPAQAFPLDLVPDVPVALGLLSIDDNGDSDLFSFVGEAGALVTASAAPADPGSYLEGSEGFSCSPGSFYDPSRQHNLTVAILDAGGSPLETSNDTGLGEVEELADFALPADGTYYIRVTGGGSNVAQLYDLEARVVSPPDFALLEVQSRRVVAESNLGGNGLIDPGETVRLGVTVANTGTLPADGVTAVLAGPAGFAPLDVTVTAGDLAPGASAEWLFTFAQDGECGSVLDLELDLSWSGGFTSEDLRLSLGPLGRADGSEDFDLAAGLPEGWSTSTSGGGIDWRVVSDAADSPPQAVFAEATPSEGDAFLVSPEFMVAADGGSLSFRHRHDFESGYDGAVLEASLDGGPWFDLLESADAVPQGGYNDTISDNYDSPIAGRDAWSGNSRGFITTSIELPGSWAGRLVRYRWRASADRSIAEVGWWVDSIEAVVEVVDCDPFLPALSLAASGGGLEEGGAPAELTLSTPLPLATSVPVTLQVAGTADEADLASPLELILPAGQTSASFPLEAAADGADEGDEELILSLPAAGPGFAPAEPSAVTIVLSDPALVAATLDLKGLSQGYDGTPRAVGVATSPAGVPVILTYDGSTTAPTEVGSYAVVATAGGNFTGSATGILEVTFSYLAWAAGNGWSLGGMEDDDDGDGWSNLAEYVFDTDPTRVGSRPRPRLELDSEQLELKTPGALERLDATVEGEASADLTGWTTDGVVETAEGFAIPRDGPLSYLRLVFTPLAQP